MNPIGCIVESHCICDRLEQEMKKQQELERQMERQRQQEAEREEQRRKALEQKEAARREMERQRQMEWERQRRDQLMADKQREQNLVDQLHAQVSKLKIDLEAMVSTDTSPVQFCDKKRALIYPDIWYIQYMLALLVPADPVLVKLSLVFVNFEIAIYWLLLGYFQCPGHYQAH